MFVSSGVLDTNIALIIVGFDYWREKVEDFLF